MQRKPSGEKRLTLSGAVKVGFVEEVILKVAFER